MSMAAALGMARLATAEARATNREAAHRRPSCVCFGIAAATAARPDRKDHMYVGVGTILAIVLIVLLLIWVF
jgi:hypothetical protein